MDELLVFRFGNMVFERIWDCNSIQFVFLTFKEPFGTDGRGGYFGKQGMIMVMVMMMIMYLILSIIYSSTFNMRIQLINQSYARR